MEDKKSHRKVPANFLEVLNLKVHHGTIYCMAKERNLNCIAVRYPKRPAKLEGISVSASPAHANTYAMSSGEHLFTTTRPVFILDR
jgi:hypothetical protein